MNIVVEDTKDQRTVALFGTISIEIPSLDMRRLKQGQEVRVNLMRRQRIIVLRIKLAAEVPLEMSAIIKRHKKIHQNVFPVRIEIRGSSTNISLPAKLEPGKVMLHFPPRNRTQVA